MSTFWQTFVATFRRTPPAEQPPVEDSILTDFGSIRPVERVKPGARVHSIAGSATNYQNQSLDFPRPWIRPQFVSPSSSG